MAGGRRTQQPGGAGLEAAVRDLQERVDALERSSRGARRRRAAVELSLLEALDEHAEEPAEPGAPAGLVTYAGVARFGDDRLGWQMAHAVPDLLARDEAGVARTLAAIASPIRLRILRELAGGALEASELASRLDEPSAGQLYHHLRELLSAGLVVQPRRSVYEVPDRAVIPVLTMIACAGDLASGTHGDMEEAS